MFNELLLQLVITHFLKQNGITDKIKHTWCNLRSCFHQIETEQKRKSLEACKITDKCRSSFPDALLHINPFINLINSDFFSKIWLLSSKCCFVLIFIYKLRDRSTYRLYKFFFSMNRLGDCTRDRMVPREASF